MFSSFLHIMTNQQPHPERFLRLQRCSNGVSQGRHSGRITSSHQIGKEWNPFKHYVLKHNFTKSIKKSQPSERKDVLNMIKEMPKGSLRPHILSHSGPHCQACSVESDINIIGFSCGSSIAYCHRSSSFLGAHTGQCTISPLCYAMMTHMLLAVAPCVFLLEGGYNLESTAR